MTEPLACRSRRGWISASALLLAAAWSCAMAQTVIDGVLVVDAATETIAPFAYADRTDIREIDFTRAVALREVGEYAFMGCVGLEEVEFPAGVRKLGMGCLKECGSMRRVVFPDGLQELPRYCCDSDTMLVDVKLPRSLRDIGSHAFVSCVLLEQMELPQGIKHIGSNVWSGCVSLRGMRFPDSVEELESYVLSDCRELREVTFPANSHMLGELMLSGCRKVERIVELSPEPPAFDCRSTLFDTSEEPLYGTVELILPAKAEQAYRRAGCWGRFSNITLSDERK